MYGVTVGATVLLPCSKLCVYEVFKFVKKELINTSLNNLGLINK